MGFFASMDWVVWNSNRDKLRNIILILGKHLYIKVTYLIWFSRKWISLIPGFRVIGIMSRFASEVQMTFIFWSSQWHLKGQKASVPCQVLVALMTNIISAIILAFFHSKLPHSDLESQVYSSKRLLVRKIRLNAERKPYVNW